MSGASVLKGAGDLRRLVEADLGPAPQSGGRVHLWPCPFHNKPSSTSLAVWADGWRCLGGCDLHGDQIDWLMHYRDLSFDEVLAATKPPSTPDHHDVCPKQRAAAFETPGLEWQRAAAAVVAEAQASLWTGTDQTGQAYLEACGLREETIRCARLGYLPGGSRTWRLTHNLEVPCGITIPWRTADELMAVRVRRIDGNPRYDSVTDSLPRRYNANAVTDVRNLLVFEDELDALLAAQEIGDLAAVVSLGLESADHWHPSLLRYRCVLVLVGRGGKSGVYRLLGRSMRVQELKLPWGSNLIQFGIGGGDIRRWIETALAEATYVR